MKFVMEINCTSFDDTRAEISQILAQISERIVRETTVRTLIVRDSNGNRVGLSSILGATGEGERA